MGYPGDEGGGPPDSRLDARTRRAALSSQSRAAQPWAIPPRGPAAPGEEEPGEAVGRRRAPAAGLSRADRGQPSPPGLWRQIRVRRGDQLPRRIQRQSPAPGRPLLLSGLGPQTRLRPDTRRPLPGARATRRPARGTGAPASYPQRRTTRQLPRARATRQPPPARDTRQLPRARATHRPPRARDTRPLPRHGLPISHPRDGTPARYPRHGLPAGYPGDRLRARGRAAET